MLREFFWGFLLGLMTLLVGVGMGVQYAHFQIARQARPAGPVVVVLDGAHAPPQNQMFY